MSDLGCIQDSVLVRQTSPSERAYRSTKSASRKKTERYATKTLFQTCATPPPTRLRLASSRRSPVCGETSAQFDYAVLSAMMKHDAYTVADLTLFMAYFVACEISSICCILTSWTSLRDTRDL